MNANLLLPLVEADHLVGYASPDGLGAAIFSSDGRYRYALTRAWGDEGPTLSSPVLYWVMLNPSSAGALKDDNTIRRCRGFAQRDGFSGMVVVNLYALVATKPKALRTAEDPVGPTNDLFLGAVARLAAREGSMLVAAWGGSGGAASQRRTDEVLAVLRAHGPVLCLGATQDERPYHPLRLAKSTPIVPYRDAKVA